MAEDQNDRNNAENGQIPEEKVWEMSNRDEFGSYNTETAQVARDQQQNQGHTEDNQMPAGNNSGARDATEPNSGQSNQGILQAITNRPDGVTRGSRGRGSEGSIPGSKEEVVVEYRMQRCPTRGKVT